MRLRNHKPRHNRTCQSHVHKARALGVMSYSHRKKRKGIFTGALPRKNALELLMDATIYIVGKKAFPPAKHLSSTAGKGKQNSCNERHR
jgi:hypothetical protein